MGEETDGVVESTSKLQEKIKALTGVDIVDMNGAYKDTYTILKEIGSVWQDLDPMDQAAALELMAGKNRANTLAAILNNMKDLEGAYEAALNAEGSALKENEAYLDSIQGRIDLFTNSLQTFWMNLLDTSLIKGVVDAGTILMKFLDTLIGKLTALAAVPMLYNKLKKGIAFTDMFKGAASTITNVGSAIKSLIVSTQLLTGITVKQTIASKLNDRELKKQIISAAGLDAVNGQLTQEQIEQTGATLAAAYANGKLSASQYISIASTMGLKAATEALGQVLSKNRFLVIAAAVALAGVALDAFTTTVQEAADKAKEAFDEIQSVVDSTKSTIQGLESELSTIGDKIDSLDGKSLSFAEGEELEKLKKQREELEHSLKVQENLLELQKQSQAKQAVASMKAYTKAASQGAEETQKTAKTVGSIGVGLTAAAATLGVLLAPFTAGTSLAATLGMSGTAVAGSVAAMGAAGAFAGNKVGELAGSAISSNDGTYEDWYETYTKALDTAREDEQKALKDYEKDSSNIDKLDKWREAQKKVTEIETEMYDHLSQMQQYYNGLEYGKDPEIDKELDAWNNFLDKFSIAEGASGAEVTALDRIFGENASEEIKKIKSEIESAIKEGKEFDFSTAIDGCEELDQLLQYIGLDAEDVKNYFTQVGEEVEKIANISTTDVYSSILSSIEAFNEMQKQSAEIVHDNMKISEDYYNSLKDQLGDVTIGEEGFAEAIDTTNGYVVKDAALLKKLISQSKNAKRATIEVAKAQAQLEYKELVGEIRNSVNAMATEYKAYGLVNNATLKNISTMREQLQTLKQTIQQYALLEISLSSAANAYAEYEAAKERDSKLTYDDSFLEMLQTIDQGILKNETGTEAFEYAVKAIVPEEFWKDIDNVDEKIRSIHDYIDGDETFSKFFTVDNESGELDVNTDNVREFIKMAEEAKLVTGDSTGFSLSDGVEGIEDFAEALGITEAAALALLSATEKVDAKWGNILTDVTTKPLEREVNYAIEDVDDAAEAMESFWEKANSTGVFDSEEYEKLQKQLDEANKKFEQAEQTANDNARNWNLCQSAISSYRGELKLTQEEVNALAKSLGFVDENGNPTISVNDDGSLQLTDEQLSILLSKIAGLEEPSVMRVQLRYDEITSQIDELNKYIKGEINNPNNSEILKSLKITNIEEAQKKLDELVPEQKEIEYTYKITETSAEQDKSVLESYQELAKNGLEFTVTADVKDAKDGLSDISDAQGEIKEEQTITFISNASTFEQAIKDAADEFDRIKSKVVTLTVDIQKNETVNSTLSTPIKAPGTRGYTMALGNAFASGNVGLKTNEHNAIVGELGPELVCDTLNNRYYTVGENGTEMVDLPRGSIIYNHKQTEELLKNGHTSRGHYTGGLSFATGSAFGNYGIPSYHPNTEDNTSLKNGSDINNNWDDAISGLSSAADKASDAASEFAETMDWIAVRMEEHDEKLAKLNAELENQIGTQAKNSKINQIINRNKKKLSDAEAGAAYYEDYAQQYYNKIPKKYRTKAKNGAIDIKDFTGDASEATVEAIQKYREYAQKAAELIQQQEEIKTENSDWARQKFDNIATDYDNQISALEDENSALETNLDLQEGKLNASKSTYDVMIQNSKDMSSLYTEEAKKLQENLDNAVKSGDIKVGDDNWIEMTKAIQDAKYAAQEYKANTEDLALDKFNLVADDYDGQIDQLESANDQIEAQIDLMEDMGYEAVNSQYDKMIGNTEQMKSKLQAEKAELIAIRDEQVALGNMKVGGKEWLEMESKIADVDEQIIGCTADLEKFADSKINTIVNQFENLNSLLENTNEKLQDQADLEREMGNIESPKYYVDMAKNTKEIRDNLEEQRDAMQATLDAEVAAGRIDVGDDNWYEHMNAIADVDASILQCTSDLEGYQNTINQLYWDSFDELVNQLDYISNETKGLIDLMDSDDMFTKPDNVDGWTDGDVVWSDEGLATLGLHAQEMERAEEKAKMYAIAIDDLTAEYQAGHYSESEYKEKLDELVQGQYDAIEAAQDEKDAIVDLNKERIEAVKEGIEKQIDAYSELIEKQKEELNTEKDLHDFQKGVADQQKNIATIERQLAALANDNSMAAIAKRKQLEAELAEAQYELEETYYDRSVEDKQTALDKELESFTEQKEAEIAKWDEYMTNVEAIVTESLGLVRTKADEIGQTLTDKTTEYNLTVSSAVLDPWKTGATAIDEYTSKFGDGGAISTTISKLDEIKEKWLSIKEAVKNANSEVDKYNTPEEPKKEEPKKETPKNETPKKENSEPAQPDKNAEDEAKKKAAEEEKKKKAEQEAKRLAAIQKELEEKEKKKKAAEEEKKKKAKEKEYYGVALAIWNGNYGWGTGETRRKNLKAKGFDPDKVQKIVNQMGKDGYVHNGTWPGKYHGIKSLAPYHINKFAKGTLSASKNQLALIDELGEELQLVPNSAGRLEYIKKGTGIVPADLTSRLINLAIDPQEMLDRNRPAITPNKNIVNTEINLDCRVGELVHIEHCDQSTLPDVEKLVNKAFDKHMQNLNNNLKRFTR